MRRSRLGRLCLTVALGLAAIAAMPGAARAQNAEIRGQVRSDNGEAVVGANVYIVELAVQAGTNDAGRFVLTVPGDRVRGQQLQLRVRAIGYRPNSRAITVTAGQQSADFTLVADVNRLDEIVVTGVLEGTSQAKVPFTVARVDMADVPVPPVDPLRMLAGRVPGAIVTSFNGRPGAAPEVMLRGPHSINASGRTQGPLYIVDGVIINGSLPDINPSDIENVEVVKGAAASSLYGARGGNGVISITTRSGARSADGMTFNVRTEGGRNDIERDFGLARNTYLLMDERNERFCRNPTGQIFCSSSVDWATEAARINNEPGDAAGSPLSLALDAGASASLTQLRTNYQAKQYPGRIYNAVDQAVTPQEFLQSNVDATGRYGQTRFFVSGSYLDQAGALRFGDGFQRYTGRVNVDQQIGTQWQVGLRTYFVRSTEDNTSPSFFRLTRAPAIANTMGRDTLGRLYVRPNIQQSGVQNENPLYAAENTYNSNFTRRFIGGSTVRFQPVNWLDFEGQFSYDYASSTNPSFRDKGYRNTVLNGTTVCSPACEVGNVGDGQSNAQSYNAGLNVSARRNFGRDISTRWTARYAYDQQDNDERRANGNTLSAVGIPTLNNATIRSSSTSEVTAVKGTSFAGGVNLEIKERYIVDAVVRREGSSLFGSAARWSTFGRGSVAWRLSSEPWWFAPSVLNDFKFRASYGTAGGRPNFNAQYETFAVSAGGITLGALGNKNLRPEKTFDTELGVDFELFRRIGVNLTYAHAETRDQIHQVRTQADDGFSSQWQNIGTLDNKTWELAVNLPIVQRRDISWSMRFSYDRTRTMITALNIPPQPWGGTSQGTEQIFRLNVGERYGTFYGHQFLTSCGQLPDGSRGGADFRSQCGTPTSNFQVNDEGYLVWTGGYGLGEGITRNLWGTSVGGLAVGSLTTNAPWGRAISWGMPITLRDSLCEATANGSCGAINVPLGNALPDWNFAVSQTVSWRRLSVFALLQGVMGRDVWNQGRHWAHLDLLARDIDQAGKSAEAAKPIGYYWRGGSPDNAAGVGGFYDILAPHTRFVEDASYAKLREFSLSYNIGPVRGVGNWTASLVGRNLFTITNYTGFDPEVGLGQGISNSGTVVAVDAFSFPNTRQFTFGLSTSF